MKMMPRISRMKMVVQGNRTDGTRMNPIGPVRMVATNHRMKKKIMHGKHTTIPTMPITRKMIPSVRMASVLLVRFSPGQYCVSSLLKPAVLTTQEGLSRHAPMENCKLSEDEEYDDETDTRYRDPGTMAGVVFVDRRMDRSEERR